MCTVYHCKSLVEINLIKRLNTALFHNTLWWSELTIYSTLQQFNKCTFHFHQSCKREDLNSKVYLLILSILSFQSAQETYRGHRHPFLSCAHSCWCQQEAHNGGHRGLAPTLRHHPVQVFQDSGSDHRNRAWCVTEKRFHSLSLVHLMNTWAKGNNK